jgi:hypothetical protein
MFPAEFEEIECVEPAFRCSRKTRGTTQGAELRTSEATCSDGETSPKLPLSAKVEPQTKPTRKRQRFMKSPTLECPGGEKEIIDGDRPC